MVGVPKRVKACEACRKRRLTVRRPRGRLHEQQLTSKQCDYGRPMCYGCKTNDRDCRYPNAFTFVVNDAGSHRTIYRKPDRDRLTDLAVDRSVPKDISETNNVVELAQVPPPPLCMTQQAQISCRPVLSIPQHVSNISAMQQQLLSYALYHFSPQPSAELALVQTWIPTLQQFATSSNPLKSSSLACCAAWIARADFNSSMTDFSRHLYAMGLHEVRTALRVPGALLDDETLGACLALAAFEVFECPDQCRAAYQWHRRASVDLVHLRGAKRHREGLGHELFLAVRLHGVSELIPVQ
jgi:hypothetical protein